MTLALVAEEVDLVDFLAIELIRVFHPEVYLGVVQGKDMLVPERQGLRNGIPSERLREWTEALCAKASPDFQDSIRQILRGLFPELARTYGHSYYTTGRSYYTTGDSDYTTWRKNCQVCSFNVFDKFFLLAIPTGDISEVEIAAFVEGLADADKTANAIRQALNAGKARRLLERLRGFTNELPVEHVRSLVKVMFDLGDDLRFKSRGLLDLSADLLVPGIIYLSLQRLESEDALYELLLKSVKEGAALYTAVQAVREGAGFYTAAVQAVKERAALYTAVQETSLSEPKEESKSRLISEDDRWEGLRDAAVARILAAKDSGELWNLDQLLYVLFRWLEWTSEKEVREAVDAYTENDDKLIDFIGHFVSGGRTQMMSDKIPWVTRIIHRQSLETFLDLDAAETRLEKFNSEDDETNSRVKRLITMIEAKDDPWDK